LLRVTDAFWHLKLLDEVVHKPWGVGTSMEPLVTLTLDINLGSLGLDLGDVLHGVLAWADLILGCSEEGHGHFLDLANVDELGLGFTIEPVVRIFLEAIG